MSEKERSSVSYEQFLEHYRMYETILRTKGTEYKVMEEQSDGLRLDRMRMCRQVRNYLVHCSDSGFLQVSKKQDDFLLTLIEEARMMGDVVRNHMNSIVTGSVLTTDSLKTVTTKMKRLRIHKLPIYDKTKQCFVGVLDLYQDVLGKDIEKQVNKIRYEKCDILCVDEMTDMSDLSGFSELFVGVTTKKKEKIVPIGVYMIKR